MLAYRHDDNYDIFVSVSCRSAVIGLDFKTDYVSSTASHPPSHCYRHASETVSSTITEESAER